MYIHRIVGFYVEPMSIRGDPCSGVKDKHIEYEDVTEHQYIKGTSVPITFTYGVEWRKSDVQWASRWDIYLSMNKAVSDKV